MLHEIHRRFEAAFNAADVEGLLAMYAPDAILAGSGGVPPSKGQDEIRATLLNFFAGGSQIHMETVLAIENGDTLLLQAKAANEFE